MTARSIPEPDEVPNPVSKADFALRCVLERAVETSACGIELINCSPLPHFVPGANVDRKRLLRQSGTGQKMLAGWTRECLVEYVSPFADAVSAYESVLEGVPVATPVLLQAGQDLGNEELDGHLREIQHLEEVRGVGLIPGDAGSIKHAIDRNERGGVVLTVGRRHGVVVSRCGPTRQVGNFYGIFRPRAPALLPATPCRSSRVQAATRDDPEPWPAAQGMIAGSVSAALRDSNAQRRGGLITSGHHPVPVQPSAGRRFDMPSPRLCGRRDGSRARWQSIGWSPWSAAFACAQEPAAFSGSKPSPGGPRQVKDPAGACVSPTPKVSAPWTQRRRAATGGSRPASRRAPTGGTARALGVCHGGQGAASTPDMTCPYPFWSAWGVVSGRVRAGGCARRSLRERQAVVGDVWLRGRRIRLASGVGHHHREVRQ